MSPSSRNTPSSLIWCSTSNNSPLIITSDLWRNIPYWGLFDTWNSPISGQKSNFMPKVGHFHEANNLQEGKLICVECLAWLFYLFACRIAVASSIVQHEPPSHQSFPQQHRPLFGKNLRAIFGPLEKSNLHLEWLTKFNKLGYVTLWKVLIVSLYFIIIAVRWRMITSTGYAAVISGCAEWNLYLWKWSRG